MSVPLHFDGGSGTNNLWTTCTCVKELENDLALENKPYHEANNGHVLPVRHRGI